MFSDLIKARLTCLVLLTTLIGFYVGSRGALDWWLMWHALAATALLAGGAAALNQFLEREPDARMRRTRDRPLPSGRVQPDTVLFWGALASVAGLLYLAVAVNVPTCLLGAVTLATYLLVYTPLKRITPWNTAVGAIPGALPPLMGWSAARGDVDAAGWSLFAILACWQVPHFLAIAWLYRDDYAKAGFAMLPVFDPDGRRTSFQAVVLAVTLLAASLMPLVLGLTGALYGLGAVALGAFFLWRAGRFWREVTDQRARQLFYASILYLPLLLGLMAADKR